MSREETLKQLALLMEKSKDVEVDPAWTKAGKALGEAMWQQLKPYVVVSGTSDAE